MPKKLTDSEITIKALKELLEVMLSEGDLQRSSTISNALDLINRLQAENKKFKDRQKPTGASGYKIENGKVVFFTNMLGGCKIVKENLEEVVKTLNELLQEAYAKDEIAFALKCKTEELKTAKAENERLQKENTTLMNENNIKASNLEWAEKAVKMYKKYYFAHEYDKWEKELKAEAYKEFAERLKEIMRKYCGEVTEDDLDNLLKELVGEDK